MPTFNQVTLMGNLTRDVELRHTTGGGAVCDLGLAVNERVKKGSEWVDEPVFVDCTAWGKTAEVAAEHLKKGSPVFISGRLKLDTWEADGQKRSKLKVVVDRLQLLGFKDETVKSAATPSLRDYANKNKYQPVSNGGSSTADDAPW